MTAQTALNIPAADLALAEALLAGVRTANALDGSHADGVTGSYAAIKEALIVTLCSAIADHNGPHGDRRAIATRLYDEAIDNGENLAYQIDLLNSGVISAPGIQPPYVVTSCVEHGTTETRDLASARVYVEAALACVEAGAHSHDAGVSCWACCSAVVIDPSGRVAVEGSEVRA